MRDVGHRGGRRSGIFAAVRSLRSRVLLVFTVFSLLVVGAVVFYVQKEGSLTRDLVEEDERIRRQQAAERRDIPLRATLDSDVSELLRRVESSLTNVIGLRFRVGEQEGRLRLARLIWQMELWRDPEFARLVERVVVIHRPAGAATANYYNPPRELVFPGRLDREPVRMVEAALERDDIQIRGGNRVAGPIRVLGADWGGYYLLLKRPPGFRGTLEGHSASRSLLLMFLLLVPGIIFLFGFTWRLLSRRVLEPVEELGRVARRASRGDYSARLQITDDRDEVARVMVVFNRMLQLVEEYRDEMEEKVTEATSEIERKNRELMLGQRLAATGTLASGIAHEINNPLAGMLNIVSRLEREDLSKDQRARYIEVLEENIERIESIVKRVLAVSPRKVVPTPLVVEEVVVRAVDLVRHRANRAGVAIEVTTAPDLEPVLGESNEVGQVFLNLLINAVDACRPDEGRVDVRIEGEGDFVRVEIEDNGAGMEPEVAERAFDMFFTTKDAGKGTGLGLATVHSLVQAHSGSLDLRTVPGEGTCFTVRLPCMGPRDGSDA